MEELLKSISYATGTKNEEINYDDAELLSLFTSNKALGIEKEMNNNNNGVLGLPEVGTLAARKMLSIAKIKTFEDLICFISMLHGIDTWYGNFRELLENKICIISELPCYKEHIENKLINNGVDEKTAFDIAENVSKGCGISNKESKIMMEHNISNYYIDSCKKIKHLYPKDKAVSQAIDILKLAWYKIHTPKEFYCSVIKEKYKDVAESILNIKKDELRCMINIKNNPDHSFLPDVVEKGKMQLCEIVMEIYMRGIKISYSEIQ